MGNNESNESIKNNIIIIFKESMKFAIVGVAIFLIIGTSILYLLMTVLKMDEIISALLAGIVSAVLIVIVDFKKLNTTEKITECNRRIFRRIFRKFLKIDIKEIE